MFRVRYALLSLVFLGLFFAIPSFAHAVCPVCTIAVGAGIGFSRWLGIDDTITGLWVGGLIVSSTLWTVNFINKKKWTFPAQGFSIAFCYFALVLVPFYWMGILGHPGNTLLGIDKLLIGITLGSISFFGCAKWYEILKKKNGGHAHFPFQKVAMPIAPLIIGSILFYFVTK